MSVLGLLGVLLYLYAAPFLAAFCLGNILPVFLGFRGLRGFLVITLVAILLLSVGYLLKAVTGFGFESGAPKEGHLVKTTGSRFLLQVRVFFPVHLGLICTGVGIGLVCSEWRYRTNMKSR